MYVTQTTNIVLYYTFFGDFSYMVRPLKHHSNYAFLH